jgi:IMP dehydrogenase
MKKLSYGVREAKIPASGTNVKRNWAFTSIYAFLDVYFVSELLLNFFNSTPSQKALITGVKFVRFTGLYFQTETGGIVYRFFYRYPSLKLRRSFKLSTSKILGEAITFDDVLLIPAKSDFVPSQANTSTRLTNNIHINLPLVSAAMDTVTESALAIALAQEGGIGIIHKNLTVEAQKREVAKVKRSENGVIIDPVTLTPNEPVSAAMELMAEQNVSGIPIVDGRKLVGILTRRDLKFLKDESVKISEVMTKNNLVTGPAGTTLEQAQEILQKHKVEKLLLVNDNGELAGLITMRDIDRVQQYPKAARDSRGRLRVGAAVGVHEYERIAALIDAEVDVIVVDTAHGHSQNVIDTVKKIKSSYKIDVIAGNIATAEATRDLINAGVNAVKVGIGPGAICTTRIISGVGVPQVSAIMNCVEEANKSNIPVIADGGIRHSGDITKAIAAGASSVMLGSLFA